MVPLLLGKSLLSLATSAALRAPATIDQVRDLPVHEPQLAYTEMGGGFWGNLSGGAHNKDTGIFGLNRGPPILGNYRFLSTKAFQALPLLLTHWGNISVT